MRRLLLVLSLACALCAPKVSYADATASQVKSATTPVKPITVSFMGGYDPDTPEGAITRQILALVDTYPELHPIKWGGLDLPGAGGRAPLLLAMAGGNAPDIYNCWFHIIQNDIENGFLAPLNEWISEEQWQQVPELWRKVATRDGKIYGLPTAQIAYYGIVYRKDLVRAAGMDPEKPPETWDEFYRWCQKLTHPRKAVPGASLQRGQRAFGVSYAPWNWLPWMQSAGGSPIVQVKDGVSYPMEDTSVEGGTWRANFDSPEAIDAARFLHRLIWQPWRINPETGEPEDLTPEAAAALPAEEVATGVVRPIPISDTEAFVLGEVAAIFADTATVEYITAASSTLDPDLVGIMPIPARRPGMKRTIQAYRHFWGMSEGTRHRTQAERDLIYTCIERLASPSVNDAAIREKVLEGNARWCNPEDLERLGLHAYLDEVPQTIRQLYQDLHEGKILARTEPYVGFWQGVSDLLQRRLLGILISDAGSTLDVAATLRAINEDANNGLMFSIPEESLTHARPWARTILALVLTFIGFLLWRMWRAQRLAAKQPQPRDIIGSKRQWRLAMCMLAPALISITLWSYYPLFQGVIMAFKNYHIVGESAWVGLDNFIMVAGDPGFWAAIGRTLKYVFITMLLGFTTPVILAILLSEIPYGRVFFRTLYFLPHLTSTLVITLLWQMMYDPTENGMLNQMLMFFGLPSQSWLQDPALAMVCCVLPGVWAGMGMSSLIYIAALQALPRDYYEAAAIDGAGFMMRLRHVMLPQLMPLMVINFVGAFIASFQNIGSIFLLTFGGPGDTTNVLSLAIWKEAYNNLRFGTATTMAWFLGTGLICFTYLQFRILRKVEFRRAETN